MWGDRTPVPLNSTSVNSPRLETRVTESIACGPAFAHDKADCGATERRCLYEECFNGDGAVVSYLNDVRRTKETTMKLCREAVDVADRGWTRKFVQEPPDKEVA